MELSDLLRHVAETLERLQIPYLVTGSVATIAYGEPRLTNDIDIVVELPPNAVTTFCAAFPEPDYYCPRDLVEQAVKQRFPFNIIHPSSGLKIDVMLASNSEFDRSRLARAVRVQGGPEFAAWFASPEDVIIKKLAYFKEGGSEKHIRDILGVLKIRRACGPRIHPRMDDAAGPCRRVESGPFPTPTMNLLNVRDARL